MTSILRQNPLSSPTNLASVTFRVTFTNHVQNVDTADFSLATTGTATGAIGSVVVQSARVYDVVITGVGGNGVLDLNLAAVPPGDIADVVGNLLGSNPVIGTEETYTIDTAAPSLLSFTRQIPATSPTNADTLVFRATFSEGVQNVDSADFTLNGTTTATVTGLTAVNASTYNVTVSGGDLAGLNGTVGLDLAAGQNITDLAGNALPAGEPTIDQTYLLDNTSLGVTSILRQNPLSSPTNLASVTFRVTFTNDVQNVDTADFSLAATGTATGTVNSIVVQSALVYDVVITGLAGDGTLDLNLAPANDIADLLGNPLGSSPGIGTEQTYAVDRVAPSVTISQAAGQSDPSRASSINFRVVFSEAVADFASGDVTVSGTAGATAASITVAVPMDGATYNVAVSGMTSAGTVVIAIAAGVAHDAASNGNAASTNLDNSVRFTFTTSTALTASPNPSAAGQTVIFTATVTSAGGTPTGTVTFREGATALGSGTLNGAGQATFTTGCFPRDPCHHCRIRRGCELRPERLGRRGPSGPGFVGSSDPDARRMGRDFAYDSRGRHRRLPAARKVGELESRVNAAQVTCSPQSQRRFAQKRGRQARAGRTATAPNPWVVLGSAATRRVSRTRRNRCWRDGACVLVDVVRVRNEARTGALEIRRLRTGRCLMSFVASSGLISAGRT